MQTGKAFVLSTVGIYFHLLYGGKTVGEELKKQDTKWVARLQMLARSPWSWKPYSLKILTPTPKHGSVEHWLQGGFWYWYPLQACWLSSGCKWHTWTSLECLLWAPPDLVSGLVP